jgi:Transglycosylase SLT domain
MTTGAWGLLVNELNNIGNDFTARQADTHAGLGMQSLLGGGDPMQAPTGAAPPGQGRSDRLSPGSTAAMVTRAKNYAPRFMEIARRYKIPPDQFMALFAQESGFNPEARGPTGDVGIGQFTGPTAARYGLTNPLDPYASAEASAQLLSDNYKATGNWPAAFAAYNTGLGNYKSAAGARYLAALNRYTPLFSGLVGSGSGDSALLGQRGASGLQDGGQPSSGTPAVSPFPSTPPEMQAWMRNLQPSPSDRPEGVPHEAVSGADPATMAYAAQDPLLAGIPPAFLARNPGKPADQKRVWDAMSTSAKSTYLPSRLPGEEGVDPTAGPSLTDPGGVQAITGGPAQPPPTTDPGRATPAAGAAAASGMQGNTGLVRHVLGTSRIPGSIPRAPNPRTDVLIPNDPSRAPGPRWPGAEPGGGRATTTDMARYGRPGPATPATADPRGDAAPRAPRGGVVTAGLGTPQTNPNHPEHVKTALKGDENDPPPGQLNKNGYFPYHSVYGDKFTLPNLVYNIKKANPGISPGALWRAVELARPLLQDAAQEHVREYQEEMREQIETQREAAGYKKQQLIETFKQAKESERIREFVIKDDESKQSLFDREKKNADDIELRRQSLTGRLSQQERANQTRELSVKLTQQRDLNNVMHQAVLDEVRAVAAGGADPTDLQEILQAEQKRSDEAEKKIKDVEDQIAASGVGNGAPSGRKFYKPEDL